MSGQSLSAKVGELATAVGEEVAKKLNKSDYVKASKEEVILGATDTKYVTPKALKEAGVVAVDAKQFIARTGDTGEVSAYQSHTTEIQGTEYTIDKDTPEYIAIPEAVTTLKIGGEEFDGKGYTKVIELPENTEGLTVTLGTGWNWSDGEAPTLAAGLLIATSVKTYGLVNFVEKPASEAV